MINDILEKSCVRITIKDNDKVINQGSGVIIASEKSFYVLTAMHCLGNSIPKIDDIFIESQEDYQSEFKNIKAVSIINSNVEKDWVLIEIDFDNEIEKLEKTKLGVGVIKKEKIFFTGYQEINRNQFRPFEGEILAVSSDTLSFQIKLNNDTLDQAGEDGKYIAQGLSGSGIYVIKSSTPFLIGILNSVKSDKAWNNDINCCAVSSIDDLEIEIENLSDIAFLMKWEENLEKTRTDRDIEEYKNLHNKNFQHLQRKNKVIYESDKEANKLTQEQLLKYLSLKENLDQLDSKYPELNKSFLKVVKKFQDSVKNDYSRTVSNNNEAKDTKIKLSNDLKIELDKLIPIEYKYDITEYQIIEWLLDCSLNFESR